MFSKLITTGILTVLFIKHVFCDCPNGAGTVASIPANTYPTPRRNETVQDTYGKGTIIKDPYRWMENAESPETKKFIEEETAITKAYLEKSPFRDELKKRYTELYNYPKFNGFIHKGKKFYSYQNTGLQNQNVLYVQDSLTCNQPALFLDPNTFSKGGTVALDEDYSTFSYDGQIFSYMLSEGGTDWMTIHFKHVENGDLYKEQLTKVKFSLLAWTHDNKGLFYSAYLDRKSKVDGTANDLDQYQKLYYHTLGTDQSKDIMVVEFPDKPDDTVYASVSDCGKYLVVTQEPGIGNNIIHIADLDKIKYEIKSKLELKTIVTKAEAEYVYVANNDDTFIFRTNKDADNYKIIAIDIKNPDPKSWKDLVPENPTANLEWTYAAFDKYMLLGYTENVKSVVQLHEITSGKLIKKFDLEIGSVDYSVVFCNRKSPHLFFTLESSFTPGITYHCDLSNASFDLKIIHEIKVKHFDREKYTSEQVNYKSKDGTEVPMYISYKKGFQKNGNNPAFIYAYGAYGTSTLPVFSPTRLIMIGNCDGVHVIASIRGGGEKGEKWHRDGMLSKKQHSMDDLQAAAEYLIAQKYTNSKQITIHAISAGGVLVAACMNQRPDLFGAVIIQSGDMDMLRYDLFTSGKSSVSEFGSASNPNDFEYLIKYSPLQNIKIPKQPDQQYPAAFLVVAEHDDRVPPVESYKFIAELQFQAKKHLNQKNPFLLRVDKDAGHGAGKPTDKRIDEKLDILCFVLINTGMKFHAQDY